MAKKHPAGCFRKASDEALQGPEANGKLRGEYKKLNRNILIRIEAIRTLIGVNLNHNA